MTSANQFFTNSTPAEHEKHEASESTLQTCHFIESLSENQIDEFFEIQETISWIRDNSYTRIALQFPDEFLQCSRQISNVIETRANVKTFILADTSYRSCCIDEVAAAHSSCDAIIHYGEACLSAPTKNIAVRYVLGRMPVDFDSFREQIEMRKDGICEKNVVLVMDSVYSHVQEELLEVLKSLLEPSRNVTCAFLRPSEAISVGRYLGRIPPSCLIAGEPTDLVFCGSVDSPFLPIWLLTYPNSVTVTQYNPLENGCSQERTRSSRQLRKRLFLIEKLKDANTVGLVVGSVGVDKHRDVVQRMRALCKAAGKKIYVISVGKINVPKLANFSSDIDVFVLLSCPFGVLLDSSDFYSPVLSSFEAEIALNSSKSWAADSGWSADFAKFLEDDIGKREEGGDVSLISGKVRAAQEITTEEDGKPQTVALYTAGDYFGQRSWKGLDDGVRVDQDTCIQEGRSGIAQNYENK